MSPAEAAVTEHPVTASTVLTFVVISRGGSNAIVGRLTSINQSNIEGSGRDFVKVQAD